MSAADRLHCGDCGASYPDDGAPVCSFCGSSAALDVITPVITRNYRVFVRITPALAVNVYTTVSTWGSECEMLIASITPHTGEMPDMSGLIGRVYNSRRALKTAVLYVLRAHNNHTLWGAKK